MNLPGGGRIGAVALLVLLVLQVACAIRPSRDPGCRSKSLAGKTVVEPIVEGVALSTLCYRVGPGISAGSGGERIGPHHDDKAMKQKVAIAQIRSIGALSIPFLLAEIGCPSRTSVHGFEALGALGAPAIPELTRFIRGDDMIAKSNAIWSIGFCGTEAAFAVEILLVELSSGNFVAVESLGNLGADAGEAVPDLLKALIDSGSGYEKGRVAVALSRIGLSASTVVPVLLEELKAAEIQCRKNEGLFSGGGFQLRQRLVESLGGFREGATIAVPYLIERLEVYPVTQLSDLYLLKALVRTLGEIRADSKAALPVLKRITKDADLDHGEAYFGIKRGARKAIQLIEGE